MRLEVRGLRVPLACFPVLISEWSCVSRFVHSRGGVGFISVTHCRHRLRVDGESALRTSDGGRFSGGVHTSYTLSPLIIDTSAPCRENTVLRFVNREN